MIYKTERGSYYVSTDTDSAFRASDVPRHLINFSHEIQMCMRAMKWALELPEKLLLENCSFAQTRLPHTGCCKL